MILSQAKTSDGTITRWANTPLGFSKYLIHAKGSRVVLLAEIMDLTPIEVNDRLKEVQGFTADSEGELCEVVWEKIMVAFPGWAAQYIQPYDNNAVLNALDNGQFVIVETLNEKGNPHSVRYMGNGLCHDPKTGEEVPTITYPSVKACIILTKLPEIIEEEVEPQQDLPQAGVIEDPPPTEFDEAIRKQLKRIRSATKIINKLLEV